MSLTPSQLQFLLSLKAASDKARKEYAEIAATRQDNPGLIRRAHNVFSIARFDWIQAYKSMGLDHRRAWQAIKHAQGRCRTCGKNPSEDVCEVCRARGNKITIASRKKRKLVKQ